MVTAGELIKLLESVDEETPIVLDTKDGYMVLSEIDTTRLVRLPCVTAEDVAYGLIEGEYIVATIRGIT